MGKLTGYTRHFLNLSKDKQAENKKKQLINDVTKLINGATQRLSVIVLAQPAVGPKGKGPKKPKPGAKKKLKP